MEIKDNFLKARLTEEQSRALASFVEKLQKECPAADVSVSSVARFALEKYVNDSLAQKSGASIITNFDVKNVPAGELQVIADELEALMLSKKQAGQTAAASFFEMLTVSVLKAAMLRKFKE